jgi:putative DNA primase/helicase
MSTKIDFAGINRAALAIFPELVQRWVPGGKLQGNEYTVKNPLRADQNLGSFRINVRTGHWGDFVPGGKTGGDPISFYAYVNRVSQTAAAERVAQQVGVEVNGHEYKGAKGDGAGKKGDWIPVFPVPADVKLPDGGKWPDGTAFPLHSLGTPSNCIWFHNAAGAVVVGECRFEIDEGKEYRPLVYCRHSNNEYRFEWRWKGLPHPWLLFGLPGLLAAPSKPVLIVEGVRKVGRAQELFPEFTVTATLFGAKSPQYTDWTPLAGRDVVIWGDNDVSGRKYASEDARLATAAGALSARIVDIPESFPAKWDLRDELPAGVTVERLVELLRGARPWKAPVGSEQGYVSFGDFRMDDKGLFFISVKPDGSIDESWLSAPFGVIALTRDPRSDGWGKVLQWKDLDKKQHEWAMPMKILGGDRGDLYRKFLDSGLRISSSPTNRNRLGDYLSSVHVVGRARSVPKIGFHEERGADAFVLCEEVFEDDELSNDEAGISKSERIYYQSEGSVETKYEQAGTLAGWRDEVGQRCINNSRLALSVSTAFAGPLLYIVGEESGGFHLSGASRIGKTIALHAAGSVWGGGGIKGFVRSWRATSNGIEGIAEAHCDTLLCLDEMGQVDAKEAGEVAYMLANGQGKNRAHTDGSARKVREWRVLFLSTDEIGLVEKMAEIGRRPRAGQEVRLVDVPADAGWGLGLFEDLHGAAGPGEFAEQLKRATMTHYGRAARAFLRLLVPSHNAGVAATRLRDFRDRFIKQYLPADASSQVRSVCGRFALVAAAGDLATSYEITGWPDGEAERAAAACFKAWLDVRGSAGDHETEEGIRQVTAFIEAHGSSRFEAAWETTTERVNNRVGFRWREPYNKDDRHADRPWQYMILPEMWRSEVAKGCNASALARALVERGIMIPGNDRNPSRMKKIPGCGSVRVYCLAPGFGAR